MAEEQRKPLPTSRPGAVPQLAAPLPTVYFNSFGIGISGSDVFIQISANNAPLATLNCSFNSAKSFVAALDGALKQVEEKTKQKILTIDEIQGALVPKKQG